MPLSDGSYIPIDSCFRVHDVPSYNMGDSVSWGPHNVLQVSTRWTVRLYLTQLQNPLQKIIVRQHPLIYQEEKFSYKPVLGSKWSPVLVPEVRYPAEARLCVQTSCALVVYRVARHWNYAVHVSKGVGLCLTVKELKGFERKKANMPVQNDDAEDDLDNPDAASSGCGRGRGRGRGRGSKAPKRARGRKSSPADEDSADTEEEEEEEDDVEHKERIAGHQGREDVVGADRARPTRKGKPKEMDVGEADVAVMGFEWANADLLVVLTSEGVSAISFHDDFSDGAEPQCRPLLTPQYFFASDTLYKEGAGITGLSRIQCTAKGTDFFVVFAPFVQRIFEIHDGCVTFVGHVFTPEVNCVPSCASFNVCCPEARKEELEEEEDGTAASLANTILVASSIATPLQLFTGRFTLATTGNSKSADNNNSNNSNNSNSNMAKRKGKTAIVRDTWSIQDTYSLSGEVGDLFLGALFPFRYENFDMSLPSSITATTTENGKEKVEPDIDKKDVPHLPPPLVVIGISSRGVYAYVEGGVRIPLFACPLMMNRFDMPENRVPGIGGFALHPSFSIGLCFLINSYKSRITTRMSPALLLPISPFSYKDPFSQVMELSGMIPHTPDAATVARHLWNRQSSLSCFIWEHLFQRNARSTFLFRYNVGLNAYRCAPRREEGEEDDERKPREYLCSLSMVHQLANTDVRYDFRRRYLELRELHGVDLFIRWPCPRTSHEHEELLRHQDTPLRKRWWYLLYMTLRRCPYDHSIRTELLLGNAIFVLSKICNYMNLKLEAGETLWTPTGDKTSVEGVYCAEGALSFVQAYMKEMGACVEKKGTEEGVSWLWSPKWHSTLSSFLSLLAASKRHALRFDAESFRFPCSVCAVADGAHMTTSLSCTAAHKMTSGQTENHTTVFSGKTFVPIDMFAQDFVVTKCSLCGLCDFATGALCCTCGGLLT